MLPFFDFMVWPGTLGQVLRMRIRRVVLRGIGMFFVVILVWPGRKLSRIRGVELCKNKFTHLFIFFILPSIILYVFDNVV